MSSDMAVLDDTVNKADALSRLPDCNVGADLPAVPAWQAGLHPLGIETNLRFFSTLIGKAAPL